MKLTVNKNEMESSLAAVNRMIPEKAGKNQPLVITNVLLEAAGHLLTLSGTNLETAIRTSVGAKIDVAGSAVIPSRLLFDYLRSRDDGDLVIETDEAARVTVKRGRSKATMQTTPIADYPPFPEVVKRAGAFTVSKADFRHLISQVVFAAAREESRPVLTGCQLRIDGDDLMVVAADGFRLAIAKGCVADSVGDAVESVISDNGLVIPRDGLIELQRVLRGNGNATITVDSPNAAGIARLFFDVEQSIGTGITSQIVCQLINGTFPAYKTLVPSAFETQLTFPVADLQQAVKRASIMTREHSYILRFVVVTEGDNTRLTVESWASEVGRTSSVVDVSNISGLKENRVAVNGRYVADVLGAFQSGSVAIMEMTGRTQPVVFRSVDSDQYIYVVMPFSIDWLDADLSSLIGGGVTSNQD